MYDLFVNSLRQDILRQKRLMDKHLKFLDSAPEGALVIRKRKEGKRYFRCFTRSDQGKKIRTEINVTGDEETISVLTQKAISEEIAARCEENISRMNKLIKNYRVLDLGDIIGKIGPQYRPQASGRNFYLLKKWEHEPYIKNPDDYGNNRIKTASGILVASKNEMIIMDKLREYGIPFHYDEAFPIVNENGGYYFVDFVIKLPNGETLYWEHFGMLGDINYMKRTVEKINFFHKNGVCIGRNLIVTADDNNGDCDSPAIDNIIKTFIAPHFRKKNKQR